MERVRVCGIVCLGVSGVLRSDDRSVIDARRREPLQSGRLVRAPEGPTMKRVLVAIGLLTVFGAQPGWAQSADECVPSGLNVAEAKYPCLYSDHRALFRVVAPDAQKVRVRIGPGFDMTKGPDGIWTATTTPLVVGFHYYSLQIDGAVVADPSTPTSDPGGRTARSKCRHPTPPSTSTRMCRTAM